MPAAFRVITTAAFDRSMKRLAKKHPDIPDAFGDLVTILAADPQNTSRQHNIKKLTDTLSPETGSGAYAPACTASVMTYKATS